MIKRILGVLVGLLTLASLVLNLVLWQRTKQAENANKVIEVLDGDTFLLVSGQRVRLLSVTAPELGLCGGEQAKKKLEELISGKTIRLEESVVDKYSRLVALVYVDRLLVNEVLLREGWARNDAAGNSQKEVLKRAHELALLEKLGIFSPLCRSEKPDKHNCLIKGNIDKNDKKYYHFPGCQDYNFTLVEKDKGESWFCTEDEAQKAGFIKSQNCYGKSYSD